MTCNERPAALPLLYVHGFASSGHSAKAAVLKERFPRVYSPTLSHIPELAVETLEEFIRALERRVLLVGSSLGGFYALHLSAKLGVPAVLVNPVVHLDLPGEHLLGMRRSYFDGSQFEFTEEHLRSLHSYLAREFDPRRLLLLLQSGDELLDHQETRRRLPGVRALVDPGGDHAFRDFADKVEAIRDFAEEMEALFRPTER